MNQEQMKSLLIRDKGFLKELSESENLLYNKRILFSADTTQLNTLIKFLHFLANGEIKIKRSHFEILLKNKKLQYIRNNVENKGKCMKLINSERKLKINFLIKLATLYPILLYALFNLQ